MVRWGMAKRQDLKALRDMIAEAKRRLETYPELPEGRSRRANELVAEVKTGSTIRML